MNQQTQHPHIPLCTCESSQIHAHGFHEATGTLALQFKNKSGLGSMYHYPCTPELYKEFCAAPSKGKFFGARIKNNPAMPHTKINPDKAA